MFWRDTVPPDIPFQRALILFDEGTQTLVLQSKYQVPEGNEPTTIGWVVPVPAAPELASMSADLAARMFFELGRNSRPKITDVAGSLFFVLLTTVAGLSLATLLLCLLSFVLPLPRWVKRNRDALSRYALCGLFGCVVMAFLFPSLGRPARGGGGVDVISEQQVGIYDVRVVRSAESGPLIEWLNENDFKFGEADSAAFDSYLSKGWCFVVAVINLGAEVDTREVVSGGLAAPLIMRFPCANPVYPLALTGTGGFETDILVYLASTSKMTCDDRLTLRFAGEMWGETLVDLAVFAEPEGFFDLEDIDFPYLDFPYLCKFRDTLTPEQMREDLVFTKATDDAPYREHIWRW
jgi:hypothetical protein